MKKVKVVILCGGLGTRLREETEFRPKPMVQIGDKPILRNKNAYKISPYGLNLPCGMNITEEKVDYVCDVLKSAIRIII